MKTIKGLNKDYWLYWFASSASMAASNILQYVLSLYVLEITGSATLFASMLSVIIFPRLLLTPIAGVMADRVRKIRLMSWIVLGEGVVLAIYCLAGNFFTLQLPWIYLLVILLEVGEIFYGGPAAAILPELVAEDKIKDAISISKVDDGIVVVVAPIAAAVIYESLTLSLAFGIVAALNLFAGILQKMIRPKYEAKRNETAEKATFMADFKEGIRCIKDDKFLRVFIRVLPVVDAFFGATFSVSVMYLLRESYQLSAYAYGMYCSVTACMSMIIPIFVVPLVKKYPAGKIFSISTMLIAMELAGIGVCAFLGVNGSMPVMVSVVLITILDCMTIAEAIPMQMSSSILLQTGVEKEKLGRVSSVIRMAAIAGVAAGEMLFGILNDVTNVWMPIFLGAIGVGVSSFIYWKNLLQNKEKEIAGGREDILAKE